MYTIKLYEQSGAFIQSINEINDVSFTSQIGGGQGEVRIQTVDAVANMGGKMLKIYQTKGTIQTLIYSGIVGKVTKVIENSREYFEIVALGLASILSDLLFQYGGIPNFTRTSVDPAQIVKDIIDFANTKYNVFSYTAGSVVNAGFTVSVSFFYETCQASLSKVVELTEYWWHIEENGLVYFKPRGGTSDHRLTIGNDVERLTVEYDSEQVVNDYWLTWASGTVQVTDAPSVTAYGTRSKYENKSQITSGATSVANAYIAENKDPKRKVSAVVNANYPFFSITPGEIIQFVNTDLGLPPLQVVRVGYNRNTASLELEQFNSLSKEILTA
jgi:hypothetical protein